MATSKQTKAARQNVGKAQEAARSKRTISHMPKQTRTALGKQGAAVAQRKRTCVDPPRREPSCTGSPSSVTCQDGRAGRDELARKLGYQ